MATSSRSTAIRSGSSNSGSEGGAVGATAAAATSAASSSERELCKYFMNGVCRFGANCFNSHDRTSRPSTVCRYYLQGTCTYGDRCFYDHVRPKPGTAAATSTASQSAESSLTSAISSKSAADTGNSQRVIRLVNKPKLLTSLSDHSDSAGASAESAESNDTSPSTYYEALTGAKHPDKQVFPDDMSMFDENYAEYLRQSRANADVVEAGSLCPVYEKTLFCPAQPHCPLVHGDLCDICQTACLNPLDAAQRDEHLKQCVKMVEQDMEEAFAAQRSADKVCGVCMEAVWEKENESDKRFGILENCNHIFCLACIRKWRASKSYENKIVKACPECRVKSDFITPSKFWFEDEENKKRIIDEYKSKLGKTACKYFKQGEGRCPFGSKCFYLHAYRDGSLAQLPEPTKRHRYNRDGTLESFSNIVRIDFDFSDDEEDDFDILEFFRHSLFWDTETDSDFSDLFELSDEFLI